MKDSFPGIDSAGFRDPYASKLPYFASTSARDTWATAVGTANIPAGFACFCGTTFVVTVWTGSAWRSIATT